MLPTFARFVISLGFDNSFTCVSQVLREIAHAKLLPLGLAFPSIRHVPYIGYYALTIHKERFQKVQLKMFYAYSK